MKSQLISGAVFALAITIAAAQTGEFATVAKTGDEVTMTAVSLRVVESIANTLSRQYGIAVSAEEPKHEFAGNSEEMRKALPEWAAEHPTAFYVVPKRERRLQLRFPVLPNGSPRDMRKLLEDLVRQANEEMPFGYRLDIDGEFFTLVPTTTRSPLREVIPAMPLLDRKVTIAQGTRPIAESAEMMANALSAQSGLRVDCCEAVVAGIPWGMTVAPFEAREETARKVLERLIRMSGSQKYWLLLCDHDSCFINLLSVGNTALSDSTNNRIIFR